MLDVLASDHRIAPLPSTYTKSRPSALLKPAVSDRASESSTTCSCATTALLAVLEGSEEAALEPAPCAATTCALATISARAEATTMREFIWAPGKRGRRRGRSSLPWAATSRERTAVTPAGAMAALGDARSRRHHPPADLRRARRLGDARRRRAHGRRRHDGHRPRRHRFARDLDAHALRGGARPRAAQPGAEAPRRARVARHGARRRRRRPRACGGGIRDGARDREGEVGGRRDRERAQLHPL